MAAAKHKKIVVLDGFNNAVAALLAYKINPKVSKYLIASHWSNEPGHFPVLAEIGIRPVLKLDLALGEAVGSSIVSKILDRLAFIFVRHTDPEYMKLMEKLENGDFDDDDLNSVFDDDETPSGGTFTDEDIADIFGD